ncbi:hypothetical protein BDV41DRAFT_543676 [Aspergillus transmontanensis]|uniref:Uncharacterized protein n=1 Tax=Aspergillus transmontanensis TaxID=1034304 RepID=A0A5N6VRV5_9EURO|nr:hypothetical protein BDV41DRAFT_543676 [Aspergillus transmontanensis]
MRRHCGCCGTGSGACPIDIQDKGSENTMVSPASCAVAQTENQLFSILSIIHRQLRSTSANCSHSHAETRGTLVLWVGSIARATEYSVLDLQCMYIQSSCSRLHPTPLSSVAHRQGPRIFER